MIYIAFLLSILIHVFICISLNGDDFVSITLRILGTLSSSLLIIAFYSMWLDIDKPTAIDVYRGKTELQITSVNGIPTDTVVVFKK